MGNRPEMMNLILALVISTAIMLVWQYTYEMPREKIQREMALKQEAVKKAEALKLVKVPEAQEKPMPRAERIQQSPRLKIASSTLHGSVSLKGLRFDDLTLANYHETIDKKSPEVLLLSPIGDEHVYFIEMGWLAEEGTVAVPDANSVWHASAPEITPNMPVVLSWDNGQGQRFEAEIVLDDDYLFTVTQRVVNNGSQQPVRVQPYAYINRSFPKDHKANVILHEGPLGVLSGTLNEITYKTLIDEKEQSFKNTQGWLGITDKYWLTALIPDQAAFDVRFSHYESHGDRFQADYTAPVQEAAPGKTVAVTTRLFAGAKELPVLEGYAEKYHIPLFDRSVDFGRLYFLTKPFFRALNYFYTHLGNFGLAILLLTVIIKGVLYPLANTSYVAMNQMKRLQPQMVKLRETHGEDKMRMNQEIMALYKREKVNPASGCLPILIQIPIFFSLYKVLYVTIEMRHAPFYGWIKDLSAPDPTNLFTLFGLLNWAPPSFMHLGVLPIMMCATMVVQQKLNPAPTDPVQAKMMGMLPYVFLFLFATFPAGLVLYWVWSNILSILQQKLIAHRYKAKYKPN